MKVCIIASCPVLGGAERVLMETLDVFAERGIECCVLLPGEGEVAEELRKSGIPFAFVRKGAWVTWSRPSIWARIKAFANVVIAVAQGIRHVRAWGCDVVYTNTFTYCYGALVALALRLPHVWHLHEFGTKDEGYGISYIFGEAVTKSIIGRTSAECIVVSKALAADYQRFISSSKLNVIYPSMHRAVRNQNHSGPGEETAVRDAHVFRMVVVAGLIEGKGQIDAIKALGLLVQDGANAELFIVGGGSSVYREMLERTAASVAPKGRVTFVGRVDDAVPYIRSADLVLVCSRCEAFGRATAEAMLIGRCVVGARTGATAELIREGVNGMLYECGNPEDLALKLRFLYDNRDVARRLGESGKQWASSHLTKDRYSRELSTVFSNALKEGLEQPGLEDVG